MKHDLERMMAYGITTAAARLIRFVMGGSVQTGIGPGKPRAVLVLRVENGESLRASLGPAQLDRMMAVIAARLTADLRFQSQGWAPGQVELCGPLADRKLGAIPGHLVSLGMICRTGIDLGELRITPIVNAVIVSDNGGLLDLTALYEHGRKAIAACSPLAEAGQIRFVECSGVPDQPVSQGEPLFAPDQIRCFFQPQICCDTGTLVALRVVPRLEHPDLGMLELEDFQARLDAEALNGAFRNVLRQSLCALRGWDRTGLDVPFLTLPLCDRELADPTLAETILWELDRLDLATARLEIEISEPVGRFGGRGPVASSLRRLSAAGCRIAMGGFGSGSAGLEDLRSFGVSRVRIDRNFVAGCDHRADQQRMILAILALAEHLNLTTLGDGVLTLEEKSFLSQIGFNAVQGKAVTPVLSPAELDDFLQDRAESLPPLFDLKRKA